ncbi:MAG: hypothetical protein QNJ15_07330 [Erythrobacter sp.]|nr:hypothetical protein [Erythrobacter sp.]
MAGLDDLELYSLIESVLHSEEVANTKELRILFEHGMRSSEWSVRALAPELIERDARIATLDEILRCFRAEESYQVQVALLFEMKDRRDLAIEDFAALFEFSKGGIVRTTVSRLVRFNAEAIGVEAIARWLEKETDPRVQCNLHAARFLASPNAKEQAESRQFVDWSAQSGDEEVVIEANECLADIG